MILFISNSGESCPMAYRMKREGTDVKIYIHSPQYQKVYNGMLPKVSLSELKKVSREATLCIFDTAHFNGGTKEDAGLLKLFKLPAQTNSVFSQVASRLAQTTKVIGVPTKSGEQIRVNLPDNANNGASQKANKGVELCTEGWFNGEKFVHFNHVVEDCWLMNGNLSLPTGSQSNVMWIRAGGIFVEEFTRLIPRLKDIGYIGPVSVDTVITQDKVYFLRYVLQFKYDAIFNFLTLLKSPLSPFCENGFKSEIKPGFSSSQRITIPPYPYANRELIKEFTQDVSISWLPHGFWAEDVYFDESLRCAGSDGVLGVITGYGKTLGESVGNVYQAIRELKVSTFLQYRTDLGRRAEKVIETLERWGMDYGKTREV